MIGYPFLYSICGRVIATQDASWRVFTAISMNFDEFRWISREFTIPSQPLRKIVKAYEPRQTIPKPEETLKSLKHIMGIGIYPIFLRADDFLNGLLVDFSDTWHSSEDFHRPFPAAPSERGFQNYHLTLDAFQQVLHDLQIHNVRASVSVSAAEREERERQVLSRLQLN